MLPALIGGGISALAGLPALINNFVEARKQKERASKLTDQAKNLKTRGVQKDLLTAQTEKELLAQSGMPGYEQAKENQEANMANELRSIKESSPYGGATENAILAVLGRTNKDLMGLDAEQARFKMGNKQAAVQGLESIGAEKERLEQEKMQEQRRLMAAAEALTQASDINKQQGLTQIGNTIAPFGNIIGKSAALGANLSEMKKSGATDEQIDAARKEGLWGGGFGTSGYNQKAAASPSNYSQTRVVNGTTLYSNDGVSWYDANGNKVI